MSNRIALLAVGALLSLGVASGARSQTVPDHRSRAGQGAAAPVAARPANPAVAAAPAVPGYVRGNEADPRLAGSANRTPPVASRGWPGPVAAAPDARAEERRMEDRRMEDRRRDDRRMDDRRGREWGWDEDRHHHRRFGWEERRWREHDPRRDRGRYYEPRR